MRSEKEILQLAEDLDGAVAGGVEAQGPLVALRELRLMRLIVGWVLGEQNCVCELVTDFKATNDRCDAAATNQRTGRGERGNKHRVEPERK